MDDKLLTIFTPTYNRCENLKKLYKDLIEQTSKNFIWLVIDDGSDDDTALFLNKILDENKISIQYIKKENGGKHTAYNLACDLAKTELIFITMDSDDSLKSNAVSEIETQWSLIDKETYCGMVYLCENAENKLLYTVCDRNKLKKGISWYEAFRNNYFWGEAEYIFKTEYIKKYKFPVYKGEKFFNEAYVYLQLKGKLFWSDKSIYIRDYQNDGLTNNFMKMVINSPIGYSDYCNLKAKCEKNFLKKIKSTILYNVFSIFGKRKKFYKMANYRVYSLILCPFSYLVFLLFYLKNKRS